MDEETHEPEQAAAPTSRRWSRRRGGRTDGRVRRLLRRRSVVLALGVLVGALLVSLLSGGAPVGHFRSAEGRDAYLAAYEDAMADMPDPDEVLDVRTSFGVVRVYRFDGGDEDEGGAPLLLLPGRSSGTPMWADNLPSLLAHRSVYAADLLGEPGRSIQDRPILDDADQATWLAEVIAELPDPQVHVVGSSIGGWTAANLAIHQPAQLASLIMIEPVLVVGDLSLQAVVRSIPASVPFLPRRFRDDFGSWTAGGAPTGDEPVADMIEAGMQHYRLALPAPARIDEEALRDLAVPTLVILGEDSPMHDAAAAAERAEALIPDATVLLYAGASHAVNGEQPDRIAADIADHLAAVEG